ncbi:MAG: PTS sugar transporter subunit IIA [Lactobacillales bacterium]|jgi:PTS system mannose-specific IIA component|nr:PTS sugar transporter subunit IIA [Lactobacillales bacterium]
MKKYLIATHGQLASGLKSSLEFFIGTEQTIETIDAYIDDSDYTEKLVGFIESVTATEQAIIFTDLKGGSVNQRVVLTAIEAKKENIFVVTGTNLPTALSLILDSEPLSAERIQALIHESQVEYVPLSVPEEEEDFFDA